MTPLAGPLSLEGRVALVTGGGGAIGSATVAQFAALGARVSSVDLPGREPGAGAQALAADLRDPAQTAAVLAAIEAQHGRLDILVHCAGITRDARLWKMSPEAWSEVMAVNLDSAFHLLRLSVPLLRRSGGGAVVLVSSINALRGKPGQANYAASKAGLIALAKTAALELGGFGVRVNCVAPGWIDTPMTAAVPAGFRERAIGETPLGRLGRPEDVALAALFLCSDMSRHVTGQVLRVDGGQLMA